MATLKPAKPPDLVAMEDVMLSLSEARAARFLLDVVTNPDVSYNEDRRDEARLDDHIGWIRSHALDWLRDCHDKIEHDYRKQRTEPPRLSVVDGGGEKGGA